MTWEKWSATLQAIRVGIIQIEKGFDFRVTDFESGNAHVIATGSVRVGSEP